MHKLIFPKLLSGVMVIAGFALFIFVGKHVFATPNATGGADNQTVDRDRPSKSAVSLEKGVVFQLEGEPEDGAFWRMGGPSAKIALGANANAVLSLDLIASGGAGNQRDDGVTTGAVSGQGTTIAVEVFATGVTTSLRGVVLKFEFDASLLSYVKAENTAFPLAIPAASAGTNLAATTPATLAASGFLARAEFETVADVTGREFSIGIESVTLAESSASQDELTTTSEISFNATPSPDFDGDGTVGFSDFIAFASKFGTQRGDAAFDARFDLDGDGETGFSDFIAFARQFGTTAGPPPPTPAVAIPDANLRAVIEDSLGKADYAPITRAEMATLTGFSAPNKGIRNLTGLEHATNLQSLDLGPVWTNDEWVNNNDISDLSPLSNLTNLTFLDLGKNSISDISSLSNLTDLTWLGLWDNDITDISALSNLTNLTRLDLDNNSITDISALSNLTNLAVLYLNGNSITNLSFLSNLTNLAVLFLGGNSITNLSFLSNLTNLTRLGLWYNDITDISALSNLTNLAVLYLNGNSISDISPLVSNTGLGNGDVVYLTDNPLSSTSRNTHIPTLQRRGVTVEFDSSNGNGGGGTTTPPSGNPDLIVESPTVDDNTPTTGQSFTFSATVRNQGTEQAAATTMRYYRSDDATIDTSDTEVGTDDVSGLSAGDTSAESISLNAPSSAGIYYYGACVDPVSGESNTGNNCSAYLTVTVSSAGSPDLIVESPSVNDNTLTTGQSFTLRATVRNQGNASSASTTLRYYRSTDTTISSNDVEVGTDGVSALSAGGTSAESISLNAPSSAGIYYYGACVDPVSGESNTGNNCSAYLTVNVSGAGSPDLIVESPTVNDNTLTTGQSFTFSATVRNQGSASSGSTTLRYYRSTDATVSTSDTQVGTDAVSSLSAGGTSAESISLNAPSSAGTYFYGACVDAVSGESDNVNNCSEAVSMTVTAASGTTKLYWTDFNKRKVQSSNLDGSVVRDLVTAGLVGPFGIALDMFAGKMYWTDVGTDKIQRSNLDGSSVEDLVTTGLQDPFGIALDESGGKIYWTDLGTDKIHRSNLDGSGVEDLVTTGLQDPFGIALDESGGKIYWTDWGTRRIHRSNLDGSGVEALVTAGLSYPRGIALDVSGGKIYWTDWGTDKIQRSNLDGSGVEDLVTTGLQDPSGIALDVSGGKMYWTDQGTDKIQRSNLDGSGVEDLVTTGLDVPTSIALGFGLPVAVGTDLVIRTSVSDNTVPQSQSFTLWATVRNNGTEQAAATKLRYYRSDDATIEASDAEVGVSSVNSLASSATGHYSIDLTAPGSMGTYYYGACVESVSGESNTGNNCSSGVNVTVTGSPDLIVESPAVDDNTPATGQSFTFSVTIRNQGTEQAAATTMRYYRSDDATIDASDTEVGTDDVSGLSAGDTSAESISLNAPSDVGTYYYGACVESVSGESNTGNNCSSGVNVTVGGGPDLIVESPTVNDNTPTTGQSFTFSATVRNQGTEQAAATTMRYYRSDDATIDVSDTEVGTDNVSGLSAGDTSAESISLNAPSDAGTYYYGACVESVSGESNTDNNCSLGVITVIQRTSGSPDLIVESPSVNDNTPTTGQSITFSATVRNQGSASSASTTLRYYRSSDATISTGDVEVGTDAVSSLSAGGTNAESISLNAPSSAGTYYYGACVESVSGESNTGNNCSSGVSVTVGGSGRPDLIVESPSVNDNTPTTGQSITLSATVRNQGNASSASTTLRYYRSTNATITTGDTEVGTDGVSSLSAGGTSAESISLNAPSSAGTYYYGACVESVSGESNTGNNCSSGVSVTVTGSGGPDLIVESPTVDDNTLTTGQSFTFSATVRNQGNASSGSTTLRYYRSLDATISASDTQVGTDAVSSLSAGGTSAESIGQNAPSSAGTYYYGACVESVSGESNTGNNCSPAVTVTVGAAPAPDLVVPNPTASPSFLIVGASFTLNATVRNQGNGQSAATTLRFYRSDDRTISDSDTEVGSDAVSGLPASGTSDHSIDLTAPSNEGTYYYGVCVGSVSDESVTWNNCSLAVSVFVRAAPAPNLWVVNESVSDRNPTPGQSFTLRATVMNVGNGQSAATTLRFYRSTDGTISASDTEVGSQDVGGLGASGTSDHSIDLTAPSNEGTYYYGACVESVSDESNTGDNCASAVTVTVVAPDLVVSLPSVSTSSSTDGASFTLSVAVFNSGTGQSAATTLRFYRSTDGTISDSDTEVGSQDVGGLGASGTSDHLIDLSVPSQAGTYYYGACVESVSGESNTGNNCSYGVSVTVGPDLIVESPTVDDNALTTGQSFTFSATVRNQGNASSASTTLRYYRSTDATVSTSDTQVGTDGVSSLSAGGASAESISLNAPSSTGTYYYGACVESVSGESNTGNNCSYGVSVTVGFDLIVESPTVDDSTLTTGQSFTFSATVRNQGNASAAATTLRYYRSSDATISTGDTEVGTDAVSSLATLATSDHSIDLTAPSDAGTYYYGACVESVSGESNTDNNCSSGVSVTVSSGGDDGRACTAGLVVNPGENCNYKNGTFSVNSSGLGIIISGGLVSTSGSGFNERGLINGVRWNFRATKNSGSNSWTIHVAN